MRVAVAAMMTCSLVRIRLRLALETGVVQLPPSVLGAVVASMGDATQASFDHHMGLEVGDGDMPLSLQEEPPLGAGRGGAAGAGEKEPPAMVLWSSVHDIKDMTRMRLAVAWLSISSEVLAVRLGRAWQRRFPGWTLLFLLATLSATSLNPRNYFGTSLRCRLLDADGTEHYDYCPDTL